MKEIETVRTIDLTPTWSGIWRVLVEVSRNGPSVKARQIARAELARMAGKSEAEVMELVEVALNGVSDEVRLEANKRLAHLAGCADEHFELSNKGNV